MKLKFTQRLLVKYYITQFNALGLVSPRLAAKKAFDLFCTPLPGKRSRIAPESFGTAKKLSFQHAGRTVRGFSWMPEKPNGKKVMVLHGFSSHVYKFDRYVQPLLDAGFEVYMFDAPAHGTSEGRRITVVLYKNIILQADELFGPFYGFVAHSLGGLAVSLALEASGNQDRRLALIAPATETETAIRNFFKVIKVRENIQAAFRDVIREIAGTGLDHFSVKRAVRNLEFPVLWVHDRHDYICPIKDVQPLIDEHPSHVRFLITKHLGHNRVYKDGEVIGEVVRFLIRN